MPRWRACDIRPFHHFDMLQFAPELICRAELFRAGTADLQELKTAGKFSIVRD
jgi:hypothetical protein